MKACVYSKYGPPEVVRIEEIDKPMSGPDQLLIKVITATVNRTDCGFRSAEYVVSRLFSGLLRPKFQVLGNEFSGVVVETGSKVKKFKAGDRVFGYNDIRFGAHAEYILMGMNEPLALMPHGWSFHEAAALTEGAHYALCDIKAAGVKAGDRVMVYGATGAIGSAAVQLLTYFGADVTAVCGPWHTDLAKKLGATMVLDYTTLSFREMDDQYDFIFDAVGKISFYRIKHLLKPRGIYISTELGKAGSNIYLALFTPLFRGKKVLFPLPTITQSDVLFISELAANGKFRPLIDRIYPIDEIIEAYHYVESGQKIGNVLLDVTSI